MNNTLMNWTDITQKFKRQAADLIGMIDSGERRMFEYGEQDADFHGFLCNKMLCSETIIGVVSAQYYRDYLHISVCFKDDLPIEAYDSTKALLRELVSKAARNTRFWSRQENVKLIALLWEMYQVKPDYASYEMCISKKEFQKWTIPSISSDYFLSGFDADHHMEYIDFLEQSMRHVTKKGTHPYLDNAKHLKEYFTELSTINCFHALWKHNKLVGICYTDGRELDTLAVDERERGKGFGYYLLYNGLQNAFQNNDSDVCLYVVDSNNNAFEFYQHCGMHCSAHGVRVCIWRS